jgi:hypothetical protein
MAALCSAVGMSWKDAERDQRHADVIGDAAPHQLDRDGTIEDHGPEEPVTEVECWIVGGVAADDSTSKRPWRYQVWQLSACSSGFWRPS